MKRILVIDVGGTNLKISTSERRESLKIPSGKAMTAGRMADSQVPWGLEALNGAVTEPAWRTKPSWYLVSTEDRMIPPDAQRAMSKRAGSTVVEARGSHSIYVSQPGAVADLVTKAANGVALAKTASR